MIKNFTLSRAIAIALASSSLLIGSVAAAADETKQLEELRNTVINLLEGLVQRGVLTREQAQGMVQDAQNKAAAQAKSDADKALAEKDAVRVTHVPEIVRNEITEQVRKEVAPLVAKDVIEQAKKDKWGVPGALPDWIGNISLFGDVRVRGQYDDYASENFQASGCAEKCYLDFFAINRAGGIAQAGETAYANTTHDRVRERIRVRLGLNAKFAPGFSAGVRLATGNIADPVSTNQTLGGGSGRYQIAVDQAYLRYDAGVDYNPKFPWLTVIGGRMPNPFASTDLVWDPDLQFDGVAITGRLGLGGRPSSPRNVFLTIGAIPLQEVELSSNDKWLYAGQLGFDWPILSTPGNAGRFRIAAAYYYFDDVVGVRNDFDSRLTDFTAPQWMQKGNTLFDIRNDVGATRLFALASEYHLADLNVLLELPIGSHKVIVSGDYVKNLGYDEAAIRARAGVFSDGTLAATTDGKERADGYLAEVGFGTGSERAQGDWRAYIGYRYLERDAVIDGYADSDFHLGGTDAKGYTLRGEWWFKNKLSLGLRYLSSDVIDGQVEKATVPGTLDRRFPFGIDTWMLDINGSF